MNVTELNFLNWQNVLIWNLIKVNHKTRLSFVAVSKLISWSKTKFFTDCNDKIKTKNVEVYISFRCFLAFNVSTV